MANQWGEEIRSSEARLKEMGSWRHYSPIGGQVVLDNAERTIHSAEQTIHDLKEKDVDEKEIGEIEENIRKLRHSLDKLPRNTFRIKRDDELLKENIDKIIKELSKPRVDVAKDRWWMPKKIDNPYSIPNWERSYNVNKRRITIMPPDTPLTAYSPRKDKEGNITPFSPFSYSASLLRGKDGKNLISITPLISEGIPLTVDQLKEAKKEFISEFERLEHEKQKMQKKLETSPSQDSEIIETIGRKPHKPTFREKHPELIVPGY